LNAAAEPLSIASNLVELALAETLPAPGDFSTMHLPICFQFVPFHALDGATRMPEFSHAHSTSYSWRTRACV